MVELGWAHYVLVVAFYLWIGCMITLTMAHFEIVRGYKALVHVAVWPFTLALLGLLEVLAYMAEIPKSLR